MGQSRRQQTSAGRRFSERTNALRESMTKGDGRSGWSERRFDALPKIPLHGSISMKSFFALALLVPMLAIAGSSDSLDLQKVISQQKQIRTDLMASKDYRGLSEAERNEVLSRQDSLFRMFEGKQEADELTADERTYAFNQLEWIEGALNDEQDDRMVCKRERQIGSNRMTRVCRTAKQAEEERELARQRMDDQRVCGSEKC